MARHVHFLGIGGSGASAAAALAQAQGFEITGCDLQPHNEFTTVFQKSQLSTNHSASHFRCGKVDLLAVTPAIFSSDPQNPELLEAKKRNIPILTWQQFLGEYLTREKFVIAVCGTHGKTTTTAMIATILEKANLDPTVELGGIIPHWGKNYRAGKGRYFVVEADEFNDNFLHLKPNIIVVTNIEMDHPEYFKDFEAVKISFKKFLESAKKKIIANLSDPGVKQTLASHSSSGNTVIDYSRYLIDFPLQIPGGFNIMNASAAFQTGLLLGIDPQLIKQSLENYSGVGRRFEYIGEYRKAKVYSDFGHHPTEIKVTMEAAREKFPRQKILLVYQPHMFSRTKALFADFVNVFRSLPVDKTLIIDIYPSREVDTGLTSSKELVKAINKLSVLYIGEANQALEKIKPEMNYSAVNCGVSLRESSYRTIHPRSEAAKYSGSIINPGDIVFFMSAGDTDKLAKELVKLSF